MNNSAESRQRVVIGIDLGGTNVRVGAFLADGSLLYAQDQPILAARGAQFGLAAIFGLLEKVITKVGQPLSAIGVASTGPLDREKGYIQNPYTLPGWENVDIISPLREKYGVPIAFENDADAAALGEYWMGAGKGVQRLVMVTIGTGIGTAMVIKGQIYRGLGGEHPEGGHILIDPQGPACYCGAHGCWESLASGPAIANSARQQTLEHNGYLFTKTQGDVQNITAEMIFAGDLAGDELCHQLVERAATYIGLGLVSLMMLTLPDCIILGGGVMSAFSQMETNIRKIINRHNVIIPASKVSLLAASLGQSAGIYGAAQAALAAISDPDSEFHSA